MKRALRPLESVFYLAFVLAFIGIMAYHLGIQPLFGTPNQTNIWICVCLACGGMLMMAVYNTALRLFTKGEKAALYFSLYCVGQSSRFFFMQDSIGFQLFPSLPPALVIYGLRYFAFCVAIAGMIFFVYEIFGEGRSKKIKYALIAMIFFVSFFIAAAGLESTIWRPIVWLPAGVIFHVVCIYVIVKSPEFRKNKLSVLYLVGFLLYCVSFFITATSMESAPYIAVMFNFIFAAIHSILLSDRFAKALGAVEEANAVLEDKVTERTAELMEANESLAASERSVREAVANISHDLKTPMSVLSVNLEMALDSDISPDNRRRLSIAYSKGTDLARLIQNLLEVGNLESGKTLYRMAWVSLASLLSDIAARYTDQMEAAGIALVVSYRQDLHVWVDENQLWRVFNNLLDNAQRYTAEGGAINVASGEIENGLVSVSVSDTGSGIETEHLPYIFDRFYKADKARGASGTGMGLYIVRTAIEAMGGTVDAESEPGKGTTISFVLKAKE